ncbi:Dps family protein [Blastomonas aquatica]|uniref:DNA starvation/stationary phase protection protein n=1 Tax=Blastomonas aquatica TaxID=1510276 RepID=A0ABQ1JLL4_9SPHN|nr:DNA starvation/stationary phase protection protein [Blastomonas aquatica]GGB72162.1 DNA starvation/stationary phase protection protein [Blastomonas aquatica]
MATTAKAPTKANTPKDNVNTGIEAKDRKEVAKALQHGLADTYSLYLKTLGVHWNIVGPAFYSVHKLTEVQYEDLHAAADVIAERIRALGHIAPASFGDYTKLSVVDSSETPSQADAMLKGLITDNEAIAKRMREFVEIAEDADDVFTADLLTARIGKHEESAWMLRALIS